MEIWGLEAERFKQAEKEAIETIIYYDSSNQKWVVHRTSTGIFFGFFGEKWRQPLYFDVWIEGNVQYNGAYVSGSVHIRNNSYFYVDSTQFDDFLRIRELLTRYSNRQVWSEITELFRIRMMFDTNLLDCEMVKRKV